MSRKRFFAWGIDQVMRIYEPQIAERKKRLFGGLSGEVLEIGPGTGPNLKYMSNDVKWVGVEPNPFMRRYLEAEASRLGINAHLIEGSALDIPLPDESVDTVLGTLVLCSVPDPSQTLKEVMRVLRPGGQYHFIEHVAAEKMTPTAYVQRFMKPMWCYCADGCHVDRKSWSTIEAAGFSEVEYERFHLKFPIISPHIMGVAVK
ncbi:MAG: methyltransferase domain-containing protein [Fimbriimonadaceae bacterium]|jgi:ubiquinone/menaquinone biosynthesis C-methylase UbiE|nr:methyltransferase domain-containing protein [Fimbriimonadaceae bacterium]